MHYWTCHYEIMCPFDHTAPQNQNSAKIHLLSNSFCLYRDISTKIKMLVEKKKKKNVSLFRQFNKNSVLSKNALKHVVFVSRQKPIL